jgi:hypothetical protein
MQNLHFLGVFYLGKFLLKFSEKVCDLNKKSRSQNCLRLEKPISYFIVLRIVRIL